MNLLRHASVVLVLAAAGCADEKVDVSGDEAGPCPDHGVTCTPADPCHRGAVSCASGTRTCLDLGVLAADGTACGEGMACRAGGCVRAAHSVGGVVTGLAGVGLVLSNGGGDEIAVLAAGAFAFPTRLAKGASYDVRIVAQPTDPTQTCAVANGAGTVGEADVTDVAVTCATATFRVRGTVSGLTGAGLVLANSVDGGAAEALPVSADGFFAFGAAAPSGSTYAVSVQAQPTHPAQVCTVEHGSGTIGGSDASDVAVTCAGTPSIESVVATPALIQPGATSTLSWVVTGATAISIDNGVGVVTGTSKSVSPAATTTYTLTASNAAGSRTAQVTVTVMELPAIASFVASPAVVRPQGPTTLSWVVTGATAISIDNGVGAVTGTSKSVSPAATTTYTLTATNAAGSSTAQVTVTVMAPPVIAVFIATPALIRLGESSTLRWEVFSATRITIDGGVGVVGGTSVVVTPTATTNYTLKAENAVGAAVASAMVSVDQRPVIRSFAASPMTTGAAYKNAVTLSWDVTGQTSLSIDNGVGAVKGNSVSLTATSGSYVLTATNGNGSSTAMARIGLDPLSVTPVETSLIGTCWTDPRDKVTKLQCRPSYTFSNAGPEALTTRKVKYYFKAGCGNEIEYGHGITVPPDSSVSHREWAYCRVPFSFTLVFTYGAPSLEGTLDTKETAVVSCVPPPGESPPNGDACPQDTAGSRSAIVAFIDRTRDQVVVRRLDGDGGAQPEARYDAGAGAASVTPADLNGDGVLDLVVADEGSSDILVFLGARDGSFAPALRQIAGNHPVQVAVGDVNGDGRPDLVSAGGRSGAVEVLLNGGAGFSPGPGLAVGEAPTALALGDLDGDGHLDLVVASGGEGAISVHRGLGEGSFTAWPAVVLGQGYAPSAVALADLNGDGRIDLVSASEALSVVTTMLGNGDGTFTPADSVQVGRRPVDLLAVDLDGDGLLDVATANLGGGTVSVLSGDGAGGLPRRADHLAPGASALSAARLQLDGHPDLASADAAGEVTLLRGPFEAMVRGGGR